MLIYPLAFYSSMHLAGVAVGTVVSLGSAPIASGLLERAIERRRLSGWWMLAAALGIAGSAVLCAAKMHDAPSETLPTVAGVSLGLVAGATYAMYSWSAHRLMNRGIGRAAAMGAVFGQGGIALLAVIIVGERLSAIGWAGLAGVCASLLILSLAPARQPRAANPSRSRGLPIGQEV